MSKKILAKFEIDYLQVVDEFGKADKKLMPKIPKETVLKMYEKMVLARKLDEKMLALQRQGRIGTFAQVKGEEACQIGAMACLTKDDWMVPSFREAAAALFRGAPPKNILLYVAGDERGNVVDGPQHDLPVSIPVGSQIIHAAGIAWAMKLRKEKNVAVVFFGDGATSEGDFHEGLNFAGVFNLPVIFICQNNQYAISVPVSHQTHSRTIAQKAIAYGIEGIQVDGNDIFAVYKAMSEAVARAKGGKGATLIECFTYRLGDHTTSDDATRYRSDKEVKFWEKKEPVLRLRNYLIKAKLWNEQKEKELLQKIEIDINKAVEEAEKMPPPTVEDMFLYMYKELTPALKEQMESAKQFEGNHG